MIFFMLLIPVPALFTQQVTSSKGLWGVYALHLPSFPFVLSFSPICIYAQVQNDNLEKVHQFPFLLFCHFCSEMYIYISQDDGIRSH